MDVKISRFTVVTVKKLVKLKLKKTCNYLWFVLSRHYDLIQWGRQKRIVAVNESLSDKQFCIFSYQGPILSFTYPAMLLFLLLSFIIKLLKINLFNVVIFKQKRTSFFMTQTRSVCAADYLRLSSNLNGSLKVSKFGTNV